MHDAKFQKLVERLFEQSTRCEKSRLAASRMNGTELHSEIGQRYSSAARRQSTSFHRNSTFTALQDEIVDGVHQVDDDNVHGFFAKGRDFESVGDAHT